MDTIEELYHGTIQPNLRNNRQSKAYNEALQLVSANEDKLLTLLCLGAPLPPPLLQKSLSKEKHMSL